MRDHSITALGSTVLLVVLLGGCKKDESAPDTVKDTSAQDTAAAAPTPAATTTAAAADSAARGPDGGALAPTEVPSGSYAHQKGQGLDACCSALQSNASSAPATHKPRAKQAAMLCQSISTLVKQGSTSRAAALTQLRSAAGGSLPGACR
jgi:hypothetical protein